MDSRVSPNSGQNASNTANSPTPPAHPQALGVNPALINNQPQDFTSSSYEQNPFGNSQSFEGDPFSQQSFTSQLADQNFLSADQQSNPQADTNNYNMAIPMENHMHFMQGHQQNAFNDFQLYGSGPNNTESLIDPSLLNTDAISPTSQQNLNGMMRSSPRLQTAGSPSHLDANSPSPHGYSPHSPAHSARNSLDPSSAAFPQGEWAMMQNSGENFMGHRRAPSDHSDISSAAHSPLVPAVESFENVSILAHHSPMMAPQDGYMPDINLDNMTLTEQLNHISPAHTPQRSPHLSPQGLPSPNSGSPFMLNPGMDANGYPLQFNNQGESFPQFTSAPSLITPAIQVDLAPPSRPNQFMSEMERNENTLSPPSRSSKSSHQNAPANKADRRQRAHSDSSAVPSMARPMPMGALSPSMLPQEGTKGTLSPLDIGQSVSKSRRSSTSSIPNRDKILELANPARGGTGGEPRKVQKHPATFQCHVCPKKFTRAYNLRSHLRTHTNERPFVCNFCGKAFARQHDRKRHEGLHSGEKKFACKGTLKNGHEWGCDRRFARADALGRHFRSEAGRICIKPLFEEEANEKREEQMVRAVQQQSIIGGDMTGQQLMDQSIQYMFPAALLAQFPALATVNVKDLNSNIDDDDSALEWGGDEDLEGYVSGPGTAYSTGQWDMHSGSEWGGASDYEQ